jgi:phage terminase large subunit-like protein
MTVALPEELAALPKAELLVKVLHELKRRRDGNKLARYRPYTKQREFHELGLTKRERLLRAGNQNGKTFCCAAEVAYHLTGRYPADWKGRRWARPVVVWASSETAESTRDNPQRALIGLVGEHGTGAIPADALGIDMGLYGLASGTADLYDYVKVKHVSGGWSTLRFKYYAQGRRKWQGPPVDFVWFDEEPPEEVYDEGLARTIATGGCAALTFTPLQGMSSVVKRFLLEKSDDRADVNMTIEDAEHIPATERERIIASFPAHEREARARGIPVLGSGRIFPIAESEITVEPFSIPDLWPRICGLDFGWDHPSASVWLAWDRDNDTVYAYDALRVRETTPKKQAPSIIARGPWIPVAWPHDGLQHEKGSGIQLAEQYRAAGVNMLYEHAQLPESGAEDEQKVSRTSVEAGVLMMLTAMQEGRFKVFSTLNDWFEEFRLYHRKDGKIVKLDDDLMSATRYGYVMLRHAICPPDPQKTLNPKRPYDWRAG